MKKLFAIVLFASAFMSAYAKDDKTLEQQECIEIHTSCGAVHVIEGAIGDNVTAEQLVDYARYIDWVYYVMFANESFNIT